MYFIPKIVCLFESPTAMSGLVCHVPDVLFQGSCWAGPHSSRIRSRAIRKMELGEGRWSPTRRCRHPRPHLHSRPHPIVLRQPLPSAIDDPPAAPFLPFPLSVAPAYGRCWGGGEGGRSAALGTLQYEGAQVKGRQIAFILVILIWQMCPALFPPLHLGMCI